MSNNFFNDYINISTKLTNYIVQSFAHPHLNLKDIRDILLDNIYRETLCNHPNPLNRCGKKVFSQNEEDGITLEIIARLRLTSGVFAEFGVETGLENNTIILALIGWHGFWVGGEDLAYNVSSSNKGANFSYLKNWITLENIETLVVNGKENIGAQAIDIISLDLDGNDYYFVERLLVSGSKPKLFIVEFNPKYPPPLKWRMNYDASHHWKGDDYYGASLSCFVELFQKHGYFLACCNGITGSNAFFIHESHSNAFIDVPRDISVLWSPCRYMVQQNGHSTSPKTVELIINQLNAVL